MSNALFRVHEMMFDPNVILRHMPEIISGTAVKLALWIAWMLLGVILGFIIATPRRYGSPLHGSFNAAKPLCGGPQHVRTGVA
ncbi:hypothetical protein [Rhizobium sp. FKY42]|uniref:hypothetical protein n=1 Tax=Rhizobium sp. FKY42 TaxID=2562310 RepID=UPI001485BC60|nr:hypothetical protein [Rhizobium sp. FKY42]